MSATVPAEPALNSTGMLSFRYLTICWFCGPAVPMPGCSTSMSVTNLRELLKLFKLLMVSATRTSVATGAAPFACLSCTMSKRKGLCPVVVGDTKYVPRM